MAYNFKMCIRDSPLMFTPDAPLQKAGTKGWL